MAFFLGNYCYITIVISGICIENCCQYLNGYAQCISFLYTEILERTFIAYELWYSLDWVTPTPQKNSSNYILISYVAIAAAIAIAISISGETLHMLSITFVFTACFVCGDKHCLIIVMYVGGHSNGRVVLGCTRSSPLLRYHSNII